MAGSGRVRRVRLAVAAVAAAGLAAGVLGAVPARAAAPSAHSGPPPVPRLQPPSGVRELVFPRPRPVPAVAERPPADATWPAPASAVISLAAPTAGQQAGLAASAARPVRGDGTPVFAQAASPAAAVTRINVSVLGQGAAAAADVRGVLFTARAAAGGGRVRLGMSYAGFAQASGGYYGAGLGLAELPACALTTPHVAACQRQKMVASVNDWAAKTVSGVVTLPAARRGPAAPAVVLALTPSSPNDGGGLAGTYNATSLSPSGTWASGGSSGSFTYSYPMTVPPAAGGLQPSLSLQYDSGIVDGQSADTQPQPSWIGDGWAMPAAQAYIEQSFIPCQDHPEGGTSPVATPDECYDGAVLTLSLGGQSTPIVCPAFDFKTQDLTCAAAADNGDVITHHINSGNGQGTQFTDYWTVSTRSGTTYTFGINHLKGWASGKPATNSVDWVPVLSSQSGDPCYQLHGTGTVTWANSACDMAYRWKLDYVTDPHGDAMAYYYKQDANAYAADGNTASASSYIRDSHLYHIDYGFTDGNAYAATVPDQVLFSTGDRCFVSGGCDPISTNYANWLDVPYHADYCAASASCPVKSPTYWSTVALTTVGTGQNCGPPTSAGASTCAAAADSWALQEALPLQKDNTASLWLSSVTRTGEDATSPGTSGGSVPLKPVLFTPVEEQNRVNPGTDPYIYRMRIQKITSETGAVTTVTYELPVPCTATSLPSSPSSDTMSCFPEYWGTFTTTPDWFNKWAVKSVQVSDPYGGSPGLFTSYQYAGPAWHYDDNEVVQPQYRTYGQWRGYQDVRAFSGAGDPQTETETTYYQGMSDDNNNGTDVTVPDSQGKSHQDADQLAGDVLESTAYLYPGGPVDHSEIYSYWVSAAAMTRTRAGLPALTANFTGQVEAWARQAITDGGTTTWRDTETDTSYDTGKSDQYFGLPLYVFRHGDLSQPSQQACTSYSYAPVNTAENLAGLPAEVQTDAAACGGSNPGGSSAPGTGQVNALTAPSGLNYSTQVISDTRTYYDTTLATGSPLTAPAWPQATAPTTGNATLVEKASGYNATTGQLTFQTTAATAYDSYGRPVKSYDANGGWNGTTYTPTATSYTMANGSTTAVTVTNPLSQSTTTSYDPVRELPIKITDANSITTTLKYDDLGRLTGVWKYNRATGSTPNLAYTYAPSNTGPTVVTTKKLNDLGGQTTTITLYDSLLRVRQVQAQAPPPQGGELVTDGVPLEVWRLRI